MPDGREGGSAHGVLPAASSCVRRIAVGELETNCYLLVCPGSREAALIDPGANGGRLLQVLRQSGADLTLVLLTHGHADHIGALPEMLSSYPDCAVGASEVALDWLGDPARNLSNWVGPQLAVQPANRMVVVDGQTVFAGGLRLLAIATPGHTPGCLSYHAAGDAPDEGGAGEHLLFSGDALFCGTVGRTDLPGGSWRQLAQSLRRLTALPAATIVLPGHGASTTIEIERATNELVRKALIE